MLSQLKRARIESGKTLQEVASVLKIRKHYLKALEDGKTELLPPGDIYTKGYTKLYTSYLGIGEEANLNAPDDINAVKHLVVQTQRDSIIVNYKYRKQIIVISILMLLITPVIYCLVTRT